MNLLSDKEICKVFDDVQSAIATAPWFIRYAQALQAAILAKLIERLRDAALLEPDRETPDFLREAAAAIEALQAENERLKRELEISKLDAKEWYSQADALQSQLDAMGKGEPVSYGDAARRRAKQVGALWQFDDLGLSMFVGEIIGQCYAAPKALEPLTGSEKRSMWIAATIELPSQENCYLRGIADAEAAHGIGGTP